MTNEDVIAAARERATLFLDPGRGLVEVTGSDRVRWLDGMISGDVEALEARGDGAGCYATLLTNRGAIIADLHVGRIGEAFWLESRGDRIPRIVETLERFVIADDVTLVDRRAEYTGVGLEGPEAPARLAAVLGAGASPPAADDWLATEIAGRDVLVGAFGWTGEAAYQVFVRHEAGAEPGAPEATCAAVLEALDAAGDGPLPRGDADALEVLRVEAGVPMLGEELDEEVLPAEARLERAISTTKGCYVGQEIVARLRARGQVNHLLVGLALEGEDLPEPGQGLAVGDKRTGELTSVVRSPSRGPIALGYVRREHAEPGTRITLAGDAGGRSATVAALPMVPTGTDGTPAR